MNNLKKCMLMVFAIGLVAYGYVFVNFVPAHDGMMVYTTDQYWQMSIGRYLMMYYVKLRGPMDAPWLIGMLSLAYIGLAVYLCHLVLDIRFDLWKIAVVSSIFTLNIAFIAASATFIYLFDIFALALSLAVLSVYINTKHTNILGFVLSAFVLALSMGAYQSYFAVAIGLYMILAVKELTDGKTFFETTKNGLLRIANLLLASGLYYMILKITQRINGVRAYEDSYNSVSNISNLSLPLVIKLIPYSYKNIFSNLFMNYTYSTRVVDILNLAIVVFGTGFLVMLCVNKCKGIKEKLLFVAVLVLFPLGLNCIYVLANGMTHQLMVFSYQLMFILALYPMLSEKIVIGNENVRRWVTRGTIVFVVAVSFLIVRFSNDLFYYKKLIGEGTETAITNIVYDIERNPKFDEKTTGIVIIGDVPNALKADYEMKYVLGNTIGVSTLGTTITYNYVLVWYLEGILGKNYTFVQDQEVKEKILSLDEVKSMPNYPHDGYCKVVDGYLVIKFEG